MLFKHGRSGRGTKKGKVIIQTYNPEHYAIEYAKNQDYKGFFETELNLRKLLKYPPFCDIILIRLNGEDLTQVKRISNKIYHNLEGFLNNSNNILFKPVPAPVDKIKGNYRYRIIIKGKASQKMIEIINRSIMEKSIGKHSVQIFVDINPSSLL